MVGNKSKTEGIRKTVYFGDSENALLEYALKESNNKFAAYIKGLIKKDMNKEPLENIVKNIVEDYLNNKQITTNAIEQPKELSYDDEGMNALNKFIGRK
ncbi:MAG: hypothetical protein LIR50_05730 [Bacillota bacterium]|nr:hypothetical protein [Bacillota bacterium]